VAHPRIQFHSLHPPPFAAIRKGLSLTEFYSGATRFSGRFSEGLLLRRSHLLEGVWVDPLAAYWTSIFRSQEFRTPAAPEEQQQIPLSLLVRLAPVQLIGPH
jgi:hypothetical protein